MTEAQLNAELDEHRGVLERAERERDYWFRKFSTATTENNPLQPLIPNISAINLVYLIYCYDLQTFLNHEIGSIQPYPIFVMYKGRKAVRVFLDMINMFEAQVHHLIHINRNLAGSINERIVPLIESVNSNWANEELRVRNGFRKRDILRIIETKRTESSFVRQALLRLTWINRDDFNLLEFAWWLRNCMHIDFSALRDNSYTFTDPETNETFEIDFKERQIIGLDTRLTFGLTRQITRILEKILLQAHGLAEQ